MEFEVNDLTMRRNFDGTYDITATSSINENAANSLMDEFKSRKRVFLCRLYEKPKKRSLDSNSYAWTLMGKLAEKLKTTDVEIYREIIKKVGAYQIVPIREDAIEEWFRIWQHNGVGWVCDDLGECRNTEGYHNIRCFYGSSTYDSKQMARLIDEIIFECQAQGIETLPPDKLTALMAGWGEKHD